MDQTLIRRKGKWTSLIKPRNGVQLKITANHEKSIIKHDLKYFRCLLVSLHAIDIMSHLDSCMITFWVYGLLDRMSGSYTPWKERYIYAIIRYFFHFIILKKSANKLLSSPTTCSTITSLGLIYYEKKHNYSTIRFFFSLHTFAEVSK